MAQRLTVLLISVCTKVLFNLKVKGWVMVKVNSRTYLTYKLGIFTHNTLAGTGTGMPWFNESH